MSLGIRLTQSLYVSLVRFASATGADTPKRIITATSIYRYWRYRIDFMKTSAAVCFVNQIVANPLVLFAVNKQQAMFT